ncbi:hypothetical protein HNQ80_000899 [Anaerosolibacter carboniphilus]|uniref:Uncharacterized protein n=1 Tax=Anaerosolibacter carboniphilus TaxID=1417629 RepID=A0A841KLW9_9FIRM|nr:hypothetical protein [Anaerosolibacter carboniphilus]MBB6214814.1 hypothetical protein [Anaerosolibacter carboniphilus]
MIQWNNLDMILTSSMKTMKFFSHNHKGVEYRNMDDENSVSLFDGNIIEYDMDMDEQGNLGMALLDNAGKLYYFFYDGRKWSTYDIHHFNLLFEEIKDLRIRFSMNDPIVIFSSRSHSNSNQWSISIFQKIEKNWKKTILTKVYLSANVVPYTITKDRKDNLYLVYLSNHNIVYDINLKVFHQQSQTWSDPIFLSNCIFIKYFHMDSLIDSLGGIHLIWIDKYKKNYCIKYTYRGSLKGTQSNPSIIMEFTEPLIWSHFYMSQQSIHIYGFIKDRVYRTSKQLKNTLGLSKWQQPIELDFDYDHLTLYRSLGNKKGYLANFILTSTEDDYRPIQIDEIEESSKNDFIKLTNHQNMEIQDHIVKKNHLESLDSYSDENKDLLRYKAELFKKNQQIEINQGLVKSLQGEVSFMKEEIRVLQDQHKKSIQLLNDTTDKYKKLHELLNQHNQIFESRLSQLDTSELKRKLEMLSQEIQKNRSDVLECLTSNKELREAVETLQQAGFFRKIFS